jgi:hypothetical protein
MGEGVPGGEGFDHVPDAEFYLRPGKQVYIAGSRPVHRYRLEWTEAGAIFDAVHVNTTRAFNWLGARAQAEDVAHTFGWKVLSVRRLHE